jgi:hypothetical protein
LLVLFAAPALFQAAVADVEPEVAPGKLTDFHPCDSVFRVVAFVFSLLAGFILVLGAAAALFAATLSFFVRDDIRNKNKQSKSITGSPRTEQMRTAAHASNEHRYRHTR